MARKYKILIFLIICGVLLSFIPIITLFYNSKSFSVLSTIFASIGAGVLCSSIVPMILEVCNDKRNKEKINQQRNVALNSLKDNIFSLLHNESYNISYFLNQFNDNAKIKRKEMDIKSLSIKLSLQITEIKSYLTENFFERKIIDEKHLIISNNIDKYLCSNALANYERIQSSLYELVANKYTYFKDEIFTEDEFALLNYFDSYMRDIANESKNKDVMMLLEDKELFYKDLSKLTTLLGIETVKLNAKEMT